MPTQLFSPKQRASLDGFPEVVSDEDRDRFFRFSDSDRSLAARFGDGAVDVALMLGALRMLGFVPVSIPASQELIDFVIGDLNVVECDDVEALNVAERSRRERVTAVVEHAGWRRPNRSDLKVLDDWPLERAMEHDKPRVLFGLTLDWLRVEQLVRPGITVIERAVAGARERAWDETFDRLSLGLTQEQVDGLDRLLEIAPGLDVSRLVWLRIPPTGSVTVSVIGAVERLEVLRAEDSYQVDLSGLSPNRVRHLARLGRRSTAQAISRMRPSRRHQVILATLADLVITTTDTLIDLLVIYGTLNVLVAASDIGVERFVNISTDKAADPVNMLGITKRIGERFTAHFAPLTSGVFMSVRFGNVLDSDGSVIPTFREQLMQGRPLTVTHPPRSDPLLHDHPRSRPTGRASRGDR